MMTFSEIQKALYQKLNVHSSLERRKLLIGEMKGLTNNKIDCFHCAGTCCTFAANSMQITPIEAFEILISLEVSGEDLVTLKEMLLKNIQSYRLDHEFSLGRKNNSLLRKTYTCPFFVTGSHGCTIKKELKPYGCLGFNPRIENDNGSQCLSNVELLEIREKTELESEKMANDFLKQELALDWKKLEIPKGVLRLLEKLY